MENKNCFKLSSNLVPGGKAVFLVKNKSNDNYFYSKDKKGKERLCDHEFKASDAITYLEHKAINSHYCEKCISTHKNVSTKNTDDNNARKLISAWWMPDIKNIPTTLPASNDRELVNIVNQDISYIPCYYGKMSGQETLKEILNYCGDKNPQGYFCLRSRKDDDMIVLSIVWNNEFENYYLGYIKDDEKEESYIYINNELGFKNLEESKFKKELAPKEVRYETIFHFYQALRNDERFTPCLETGTVVHLDEAVGEDFIKKIDDELKEQAFFFDDVKNGLEAINTIKKYCKEKGNSTDKYYLIRYSADIKRSIFTICQGTTFYHYPVRYYENRFGQKSVSLNKTLRISEYQSASKLVDEVLKNFKPCLKKEN